MAMNQVHVFSQQGRSRLRELKRYVSMPLHTTHAYNKYKAQLFSQPMQSKYLEIFFGSGTVSFDNNQISANDDDMMVLFTLAEVVLLFDILEWRARHRRHAIIRRKRGTRDVRDEERLPYRPENPLAPHGHQGQTRSNDLQRQRSKGQRERKVLKD